MQQKNRLVSCFIQNRNFVCDQNRTSLCDQNRTVLGFQKTGWCNSTVGWVFGLGAERKK